MVFSGSFLFTADPAGREVRAENAAQHDSLHLYMETRFNYIYSPFSRASIEAMHRRSGLEYREVCSLHSGTMTRGIHGLIQCTWVCFKKRLLLCTGEFARVAELGASVLIS